jgi:sortase (surface protein transpeptidase)
MTPCYRIAVAALLVVMTFLATACGTPSDADDQSPTATAQQEVGQRTTRDASPTPTMSPTPRPSPTAVPTIVAPRSTTPAGSPVALQAIGVPVRLQIPAIGVDAPIESVGRTADGDLGVPSGYESVAWYGDGPSPGTIGNAVIDGHLDSKTGPAVFWRLGDLNPGDEVLVQDDAGTVLRFAVSSVEAFTTGTAPLDRIFGPSFDRNLNLVTCTGTFDRNVRQYDQRLVVYTEFVGM